jgi:hypothetical protein
MQIGQMDSNPRFLFSSLTQYLVDPFPTRLSPIRPPVVHCASPLMSPAVPELDQIRKRLLQAQWRI